MLVYGKSTMEVSTTVAGGSTVRFDVVDLVCFI